MAVWDTLLGSPVVPDVKKQKRVSSDLVLAFSASKGSFSIISKDTQPGFFPKTSLSFGSVSISFKTLSIKSADSSSAMITLGA